MLRLTPFPLFLLPGVLLLGGCSLFEGDSVMSRLELDRIFHRVDVASEREKREREARDRLAGAYWGMRSDTLEREAARPDPNRAPAAQPRQMASTAPAIPPSSTFGAVPASVPKPVPSVPVATTPAPKTTTIPTLAKLDPERTAASRAAPPERGPEMKTRNPGTGTAAAAGAASAGSAKSAAPVVMQPVFYGTTRDPSELLEGEGERPLYTAHEVVTNSEGREEIDLFRPAYGSMKFPMESPPAGVTASADTGGTRSEKQSGYQSDRRGEKPSETPSETPGETKSGGNVVGKPSTDVDEDWAEMISSIRPFSSRPEPPGQD